MFRAVIFDFGGVIVRERYNSEITTQLQWLGENDAQRYQQIEAEAARGHVDRDILFKTYKELFKLDFLVDLDVDTPRAYADPNLRIIDLVKILKSKYKVGILSNNFAFWAKILKEQDYFKLFDASVISCDVGMLKPESEIYHLIAGRLEVEPRDCVFIDDLAQNVEGARKTGMTAVLFKDYDSLVAELVNLKVVKW